jgi:hypothetical protein
LHSGIRPLQLVPLASSTNFGNLLEYRSPRLETAACSGKPSAMTSHKNAYLTSPGPEPCKSSYAKGLSNERNRTSVHGRGWVGIASLRYSYKGGACSCSKLRSFIFILFLTTLGANATPRRPTPNRHQGRLTIMSVGKAPFFFHSRVRRPDGVCGCNPEHGYCDIASC